MPTITAPACTRVPGVQFALSGPLAAYLHGVTAHWLTVAPDANPAMLEMFRDRDRHPLRDLVPWAGEFAGKYLTGATQVLRLTGHPELRDYLAAFVEEFIGMQAVDGYLGPWPVGAHLTNHVDYPDGRALDTWDAWGHYHAMIGLLLWHGETGDERVLNCIRRIGDLLCEKYLGNATPRLVETGSTEMNLAPAHSLCLLYRKTGDNRFLRLARQLVDTEFNATDAGGAWLAGNWLQGPLDAQEFFELPKPRWEALHPIMALVELYYLTGKERYRQAFERIWWSIARLDRHNNGGFSSGEQAQGNPYHQGAIETCCTIAWTALSVEMLRLTKDPRIADELELTLWNSVIGMHSSTGRWATYNTPMDGIRKASAHDIVFQSREGSPELNCCSVNSARGFGLLSDWALMEDEEGLLLNWYGPGMLATENLRITQETDYPRSGQVRIRVNPDTRLAFTLKLRIPRWSAKTIIRVNGKVVDNVAPGTYKSITRTWAPGDTVEVTLDMTYHAWVGDRECAGLASLYRGPILLTYDRRFNEMDPDDVPALDAAALHGRMVEWPDRLPPLLLLAFTANGQTLRLCDFGSAGEGGTPYRTWLTLEHAEALPRYFDLTLP